jgi:Effector Associated Constant Component 1
MVNNEAHLVLNIDSSSSADDDDAEELAQLTQRLREDIEELDVEGVDFVRSKEDLPKGAKAGDAVAWGSLLVTLATSSGVIPALVNTLQSWLMRHEHRSMTIVMGEDKLEVTDISSDEQKRLIEAWIRRQEKKKEDDTNA